MKSDLGVPTLSSSVSSTSTTTAATSSAVKQAYDLANSAGSISDDTAALLGLDPDDNPTVNDALTSIINLGNEYKYVAEKTIY
jgi:phage-related tail fiber protein